MKIIIIGNGVAGNSAASAIRKIDKDSDITIISEEPQAIYSACALPYYIAGEIERKRVYLKNSDDYTGENIRILLGRKVHRTDIVPKMVFLDYETLSYDKLIIATGGQVVAPKIAGIEKENIFKLKTIGDADKICSNPAKTAVIIGSGLIGLEAAIALKMRGLKVFLIETLGWILPRAFEQKPARMIQEIIKAHGIEFFFNEKVVKVTGGGKVDGVVTDKRKINCDMVILSTGMAPNVKLASQAGLEIGALGGIKTDNRMQTSATDVYACGDCVEASDAITGEVTLSLLWHNAKRQGIVAGRNCIGLQTEYAGSLDITGVCVYGTHAVSIGQTLRGIRTDDVEVVENKYEQNYLCALIRDGFLVGAQSIGKTANLGMMLSIMLRKDHIKEIRESIVKGKTKWGYLMAACHNIYGGSNNPISLNCFGKRV